MTNIYRKAAIVLALVFFSIPVLSQDEPQTIKVALSRPGDALSLEISIISARIEVIGEDREDAEFALAVEQSSRNIITPSGVKPLKGSSYSLEVEEHDNRISIDTDRHASKISIIARIPLNANLDLSTVNEGKIIVRNITGELRLKNTNGPITASNITGSVIAESINENIEVSFASIDNNNAISLNSLNGNLSLGLPSKAGAQLHIDNARGEIYSDFEVEVQPSKPHIERKDDRGGIEVRVESVIVANVNGGGPVIKLKTLNGNIHIRKHNN